MYDFLTWDVISGAASGWLGYVAPGLYLVVGIVLAVTLVSIGLVLLGANKSDMSNVGSGAPIIDNRVR